VDDAGGRNSSAHALVRGHQASADRNLVLLTTDRVRCSLDPDVLVKEAIVEARRLDAGADNLT
jgi:hypothetical protein